MPGELDSVEVDPPWKVPVQTWRLLLTFVKVVVQRCDDMEHLTVAKIFTPEFNQFETINATQAWSLFFTISSSDQLLGQKPVIGRYITLALFSGILTGILNVLVASV